MPKRTAGEHEDASRDWLDRSRLTVSSVRRTVYRYQILSFLLVTFGWTFGIYAIVLGVLDSDSMVLQLPAAWGPLIGAAVVTRTAGGSLREWAGQVTVWRANPRWYLVAFVLPILITEASNVIYFLQGVPLTLTDVPIELFVVNFFVVLLLAGSLEEFGWRGFAQPRLQERYSALVAGLVIGLCWAVWHYPHFYYGSEWTQDLNIFLYTLRIMASALVFAWVYNGTGGSILLVMLFHATGNLPSIFVPAGEVSDTLAALEYPVTILTYVLIVLVVLLLHGSKYLASDKPDPLIPGAPETEPVSEHP